MSDRRAELERWIATSRANRRKLAISLAVAAVIAVGLLVWSRPVGGAALGIVAIVALSGFWILSSHIADWQDKLDRLDRPTPVGRVLKRR